MVDQGSEVDKPTSGALTLADCREQLIDARRRLRRQRRQEETLRAEREQLRRLIGKTLSRHERERFHLSRRLHDEAGQVLTALKLSLEMALEDLSLLAQQLPDEQAQLEQIEEQLRQAKGFGEETVSYIQGLMRQLYPSPLHDLGLNPALEGLCQDFASRTGLAVTYQYSGPPKPAPSEDIKITLYRCLEEALDNVLVHAAAQNVAVLVAVDGDSVSIAVEDDGRGFLPEPASKRQGLLSARERLRTFDGYLEVTSAPGKGTRLLLQVPWEVDGWSPP